jgi:hypothetical protein
VPASTNTLDIVMTFLSVILLPKKSTASITTTRFQSRCRATPPGLNW